MYGSLWAIVVTVGVAVGLLFAIVLTAWTPLWAVLVVFAVFAGWFVLRMSRMSRLDADKRIQRTGQAAETQAAAADTPESGTAGG